MTLLNGLTASVLEDMRSISQDQGGTEIEARVDALCSLMQQTATRLCPAAAAATTDAALSLLSGLQAAHRRLPAGAPAANALERSMQKLLQVLQQGLAPPTTVLQLPSTAAQSVTDGSSRQAELASLIRGLGFSSHDLQEAHSKLSQRTAAVLSAVVPGGGSTEAGALLNEPASAAPLDSLLQMAVDLPAWQSGSKASSLLHSTVAELLWVLRQFPTPAELPCDRQPQLSPQGWAAYWVLEPRALRQALAEILQAANQQPAAGQQQAAGPTRQQAAGPRSPGSISWCTGLQRLLDSKPHWAATTAAVAQHPALHLLARQTLHSWLAASGNPAAWHLLLHYSQAVRCGSLVLEPGCLPVQLRVVYPPGLAAAAALLHAQAPTDAGLCEAVGLLQCFIAAAPPQAAGAARAPSEQPAGAAVGAMQLGLAGNPAAGAAAAAERRRQVWQLQLDAPGWLLFCLRQLPLEQLLDLAAQHAGKRGSPARRAAGPVTPPGAGTQRVQHTQPLSGRLQTKDDQQPAQQLPAPHAGASPTAARYAALALWPGEPLSQTVLEEALQLQLGDVDLPAVQPWLQVLHGWQDLLAAAVPAEAVDVAEQQELPGAAQPLAAGDSYMDVEHGLF